MSKIKTTLLGLGTIAATVAPIVSVVACGQEERFLGGENVMLAMDGGIVNDNSFNVQGLAALNSIFSLLGKGKADENDYSLSIDFRVDNVLKTYTELQESGANVILAPGVFHNPAIQQWNEDNGTESMKFIVGDVDVSKTIPKNVAGITFQTKLSGFEAGVLSSLYLQEKNDQDPVVGMWGGDDVKSVVDYMIGYYEGVKYFNSSDLKNKDYPTVKFAQFDKDLDWTNSGFKPGEGAGKAEKLITDESADIVVPVAGPQFNDALQFLSQTHQEVKLIGVDSDQKLFHPEAKDLILTSILKDMKNATVAVWNKIMNPDMVVNSPIGGFGDLTVGNLENGWTRIEQTDTTEPVKNLYASATSKRIEVAAKAILGVTWAQALEEIKKLK